MSAATLSRDESTELCGGLSLNMSVGRIDANTVRIVLPIRNGTKDAWQGTVKLDLGGTSVPVRIGKVPAHSVRTQTVRFKIDPGMNDITGSLLIGP